MNNLQAKLEAAKERRRQALTALDEVSHRQQKAARAMQLLKSEEKDLAGVEEEINTLRLDALEAGERSIHIPGQMVKRIERMREVRSLLITAQARTEALQGERAVVEAAITEAEAGVRQGAGAILAADQKDAWERATAKWGEYLTELRDVIALGSTGHGAYTWGDISHHMNNLTPTAYQTLNGEGSGATDEARTRVRRRFDMLIKGPSQ